MLNEALLLAQNKRLRERNEELEEQVRHLEEIVAARWEEPLPAGWPYLTRHEERIARRLIAGRGNLVSREDLYTALYGVESEREMQIVIVLISRIRRKLPPDVTIENVHGRGYRLVNSSETEVNERLRGQAHAGVSSNSEQRAA